MKRSLEGRSLIDLNKLKVFKDFFYFGLQGSSKREEHKKESFFKFFFK
jgi:hypothetical protein